MGDVGSAEDVFGGHRSGRKLKSTSGGGQHRRQICQRVRRWDRFVRGHRIDEQAFLVAIIFATEFCVTNRVDGGDGTVERSVRAP